MLLQREMLTYWPLQFVYNSMTAYAWRGRVVMAGSPPPLDPPVLMH